MTFTYPAVVTPLAQGFHVDVPDLEGCEADGADLEDALDAARDAATDWVQIEMTEFEGNLPYPTHPDDFSLQEGQFVRMLLLTIRLLPDND